MDFQTFLAERRGLAEAGEKPDPEAYEVWREKASATNRGRGRHEDVVEFLSRKRGLTEESGMGSREFAKAIERMAKVGGKHLDVDNFNKFSRSYDQVIITFINLKEGGGKGGGARAMNNLYQIEVEGFGKGPDDPPPSGKVKAKTMTSVMLSNADTGMKKMRGKTGKPESIAKYVADYISKLAKVDPVMKP